MDATAMVKKLLYETGPRLLGDTQGFFMGDLVSQIFLAATTVIVLCWMLWFLWAIVDTLVWRVWSAVHKLGAAASAAVAYIILPLLALVGACLYAQIIHLK